MAARRPTITLHAARHTFASFAIAAGMSAKTLCVIMGHADIATTFDKYGHSLPGGEDEATARLDACFAQTVAQSEKVAHGANARDMSYIAG